MTDPTPDQIRQALDVLGIDPEDVRTDGNTVVSTMPGMLRCINSLREAVRALSDPVPVSRDTPAGTVIEHSNGDSGQWTLIGHTADRLVAESDNGTIRAWPHRGWVEVRRPTEDASEADGTPDALASLRPDPEPTSSDIAARHIEHYRSCNCLGDSSECCDPDCCQPDTEPTSVCSECGEAGLPPGATCRCPIPVEVGQTRLMPVKVKGDYGGSGWLVEFATGHDLNVQDSLVASWTPQEET